MGEVAHQDVEGGCYTKAVYHTHQNACYNWTHEHNSHCKSHPIWVDWAGGDRIGELLMIAVTSRQISAEV